MLLGEEDIIFKCLYECIYFQKPLFFVNVYGISDFSIDMMNVIKVFDLLLGSVKFK